MRALTRQMKPRHAVCDRPAKRGAGCKEGLSFRIKRRRFLGYHRAAPEEAAIIQKRPDPVDVNEIIVFRRTDMPFSKTEADAFQKQALPCDNRPSCTPPRCHSPVHVMAAHVVADIHRHQHSRFDHGPTSDRIVPTRVNHPPLKRHSPRRCHPLRRAPFPRDRRRCVSRSIQFNPVHHHPTSGLPHRPPATSRIQSTSTAFH